MESVIFTNNLVSYMSLRSKQGLSGVTPNWIFIWEENASHLCLTKHASFCMQWGEPESVSWRERLMYHLIPPSFDILFLFFSCYLSLEGCDEGVVSPPTRKLRKCKHCVQAREEYKISLWYKRRGVNISDLYSDILLPGWERVVRACRFCDANAPAAL